MGGIGKWIKKNPIQAAGLLAGAALGGPALIGLMGPAAGAGAATATAAELGLGGATAAGLGGGTSSLFGAAPGLAAGLLEAAPFAPLGTIAANAAVAPAGSGLLSGFNMDNMAKYGKLAQFGMSATDQQQPQIQSIQPPQLRGPGQTLSSTPMYGGYGGGMYVSPEEEERRRMMMAYLAQQGVA